MKTGLLWTLLVALAFISFFLGVSIDGAWADAHNANGGLLTGCIITGLGAVVSLVALAKRVG